jgi:hypothetical protein
VDHVLGVLGRYTRRGVGCLCRQSHGKKKPMPLNLSQWPFWEMVAATLAFFAWAFALPNAVFSAYSWYSSALARVIVLVASTVLGLLAPLFQRTIKTGNSDLIGQTK